MVGKIILEGLSWLGIATGAVLFAIYAVKWLGENEEVDVLSKQSMKELKEGVKRGPGGGEIRKESDYGADPHEDAHYLHLAALRRDALWGYVRVFGFLLKISLVVKLLAWLGRDL